MSKMTVTIINTNDNDKSTVLEFHLTETGAGEWTRKNGMELTGPVLKPYLNALAESMVGVALATSLVESVEPSWNNETD